MTNETTEVEQLQRQVQYYQERQSRICTAMPYWMGFLSQDDYVPALVAWINAHRNLDLEQPPQTIVFDCDLKSLRLALPAWMDWLNKEDFLPALVAWINSHRWGGHHTQIEQSWRLQSEISIELQKRVYELEAENAELKGRIANALL